MKYDIDAISKRINIKKHIKNFFYRLIFIILVLLFIINAMCLYFSYKTKKTVSDFLELSLFNIVSESMVPTLEVNDVVLIKKTDIEDLKEGDLITYNYKDKIITHRIYKKVTIDGVEKIITKGDANGLFDTYVVLDNQIYGKVIFIIPYFGNIVKYVQNDNRVIRIGILIILGFCIISMQAKKKNKRKIVRKKYEIKKLRDKYENNKNNI
jgi:signal peptidase